MTADGGKLLNNIIVTKDPIFLKNESDIVQANQIKNSLEFTLQLNQVKKLNKNVHTHGTFEMQERFKQYKDWAKHKHLIGPGSYEGGRQHAHLLKEPCAAVLHKNQNGPGAGNYVTVGCSVIRDTEMIKKYSKGHGDNYGDDAKSMTEQNPNFKSQSQSRLFSSSERLIKKSVQSDTLTNIERVSASPKSPKSRAQSSYTQDKLQLSGKFESNRFFGDRRQLEKKDSINFFSSQGSNKRFISNQNDTTKESPSTRGTKLIRPMTAMPRNRSGLITQKFQEDEFDQERNQSMDEADINTPNEFQHLKVKSQAQKNIHKNKQLDKKLKFKLTHHSMNQNSNHRLRGRVSNQQPRQDVFGVKLAHLGTFNRDEFQVKSNILAPSFSTKGFGKQNISNAIRDLDYRTLMKQVSHGPQSTKKKRKLSLQAKKDEIISENEIDLEVRKLINAYEKLDRK